MTDDNVLIVGGAVGGKSICNKYSQHGNLIIIADKNREESNKLTDRLASGSNNTVLYEFVDVTKPESVAEMMERIESRVGTISHMVSLVGGALNEEWKGLEGSSIDTINKTTLLNLLSHEYLMKYAKRLLINSPSANKIILLMSSINALGAWDLPAYSAAKAGLIGLMNGAAHEFTLRHRIRINVLLPGTVMSKRTTQQPKNFQLLQKHSLFDARRTSRTTEKRTFKVRFGTTSWPKGVVVSNRAVVQVAINLILELSISCHDSVLLPQALSQAGGYFALPYLLSGARIRLMATFDPEQALKNLSAILKAANSDLNRVIKTTVYVSDIGLWDRVNAVYADFFGDHYPARAVVPTRNLHFGFLIEIEAVSAVNK